MGAPFVALGLRTALVEDLVKFKGDLRIAFGQFDDRTLLISFSLFVIFLSFGNFQWTEVELLIFSKLNALVSVFMIQGRSNSDKEFNVRFVLRVRCHDGSAPYRLAS